jgi:hypothetical protein
LKKRVYPNEAINFIVRLGLFFNHGVLEDLKYLNLQTIFLYLKEDYYNLRLFSKWTGKKNIKEGLLKKERTNNNNRSTHCYTRIVFEPKET